jgi:purine-nucleoside phosphorylase
MSEQLDRITAARNHIQAHTQIKPQIAIILGSGLGSLADEVQMDAVFPYYEIPGFPVSTVAGHAGRLLLGTLAGKKVVVMQGRFHFYEGYPMAKIIFPIRVLHALGANSLIVTNAAGGLNPDFDPGDVMLITDHINAMGTNALIGPNEDTIGPRFPDMTHTYAPDLRALAANIARREGIPLRQGIYVGLSGPTYETPAERRYIRLIGGDAVGMSTVPEVTAANHAGMRILGLSAITNKATGDPDQEPDSHEAVLALAEVAGAKLVGLVRNIIQAMPVLDYATPDQLVEIIREDPAQIAHIIDHTLLRPDATAGQITRLCEEAMDYHFASVCINPIHVKLAVEKLKDSHIKVCSVIGFPLGATKTEEKIRETEQAILDGATEVDMVINIGALKEGNDAQVQKDIDGVVRAAHGQGVLCKVIIEASLLTDEEKERVCQVAKKVGADFVKTSTGFVGDGATEADVTLMRQTVGPDMGVKASGGIRSFETARKMIAAGANRIGASSSVEIVEEARAL